MRVAVSTCVHACVHINLCIEGINKYISVCIGASQTINHRRFL